MANLTRWVMFVVWLAVVGWLWHAGTAGTSMAVAMSVLSLLVFAWPAHGHRRRRSALRYIEMGKQPVGLP